MKVEFGVEKHQPPVTEGFAVRDEERRGGAYKRRGGAYKGRGWGLQREGVESEAEEDSSYHVG